LKRIRFAILAASLGMGSLAFGDVVVSTSAIGNRGTNDIYTVDVSVLLANIQSEIGSTIQGFNTAPPTLHLNLNNQFSDFYLNKWVPAWPPHKQWDTAAVPEPGYGFLLVGGLLAAVFLWSRSAIKRA